VEIRRLLAVSYFWDNVVARTAGGIPDVSEWHTLDEAVLAATLRNANAGKARVLPLPAAAMATATATSASSNFEKGTRRSVSDYKVFRDRKTWNQFQRGLLATAHMHGVGDILDPTMTVPIISSRSCKSKREFACT
jgi:hypothetical protein